jgi:Cytochrome c554 and c-prime
VVNRLRALSCWRVCSRLLTAASVALLIFGLLHSVSGQSLDLSSLQPGWLPTELAANRRFVGSTACVSCHAAQSKYSGSAMATALRPGSAEGILTTHKELAFERPPFAYRIERRGDQSIYTVTDGSETVSTPILWAFGRGEVGRTFVIDLDGQFQEARVSYFTALGGLDWTLGTPPNFAPQSTSEAAARPLDDQEVRRCFGCHATGAVQNSVLSLAHMEPGITCEGCHGPGDRHVQAISSGNRDEAGMGRMKEMTAEQQADFCGSCHRTWAEVAEQKIKGVDNVRFQPFRLVNSKCYDPDDTRIRCAACHDPHEDPRRDSRFYDDKCLACHAGGEATAVTAKGPACPTGTQDCSSCHMPKVEVPGAHYAFSDHTIRIVRPGEPYPN